MNDNIQKQCSFNFKEVLIEEVALQGLEGIGLDLLWKLMEKRMGAPITDKLKQRYWNFLVKNHELTFYKLPMPVPQIEWLDRYSIIAPESGMVAEHVDYLDGPYEYCPIENEYGSCKYFDTRVLICNEDLAVLSYDKVLSEYGDNLVIVASLRERWRALAPQASIALLQQLTPVHYCILEVIGRGRENGQCTIGKSNLLKIIKDSKLLFYNRKHLQKLNLIKVHSFMQFIDGKGVTTILLRLSKYNQAFLLSLPKAGPFHDLVNYLREKPDFTESADVVVKMGICGRKLIKRIAKSHPRGTVYVKVEERATVLANSKSTQKKTNITERTVNKKFLKLTSPSDESSQSEDEDSEGSMPCKYNVGVSLIRQAYEVFAEAGREGLTQHQLAQLLGIEFYTARSICKILQERNLIRVFFEDRGRQRFIRFILVSKTKDMEDKIELEKQKILEHMFIHNSGIPELTVTQNDSEYVVPSKKARIEESDNNTEHNMEDLEKDITEVKVVDGVEPKTAGSLLSTMNSITLRQLKFINGILTVMQRDRVISGYLTLNNLVSKEINEPPVDTKGLKRLVQRLVTDGQLKLMKMKWPGFANRYTSLICAADIKPKDPKLKAKYKQISMTIMNSPTLKKKDKSYVYTAADLRQVSYPKYVRIQKLHELITTLVYFSDAETLSDLPPGVCTLVHVIPEFTVAFALGNINHSSVTKIDLSMINADLHTVKLRETPDVVYKQFLLCASLQHTTRTNLKTLALLGLIQLIKDPSQTVDSARKCFMFYVNRNAKLLDTKGVWPRKVNENENIEKSYCFDSIEDVKGYWRDVFDISTKTIITEKSRHSVSWQAPLRQHGEVQEHDNGQLLGNGSGPCGFDSGFYLDAPRQWNTYYAKEKPKIPSFKTPRLVPKKKKKKPSKSEKKFGKNNLITNIMKRRSESGYTRRAHSKAIIKWTKEEDRILMYCKIASTVISPISQPSILKLNNHIAKEILSMNDPLKTGLACYRRSATVENYYSLEKEYLLSELRCRKTSIAEYEDLLRVLYLRHAGHMSRVVAAARLPLLELVWYLSRLAKSKSCHKGIPCVAENIDEFHKNYDVTTPAAGADKLPIPANPGFSMCALTEFIMQTVAMHYKSAVTMEQSQEIFELFKKFPEQLLRAALNHLRKRGAIAAVEKVTNNHLNRSGLDDVCQAKFRFSMVYQRKWVNRMHLGGFIEGLMSLLDTDVDQIVCKGSMELNCLACELLAAGALHVALATAPALATSVPLLHELHFVAEGEIKYKMKPGTCQIINKTNVKRFGQLGEPTDYETLFSDLRGSAMVISSLVYNENVAVNMNEKIIVHLRNKNEEGSTLKELQENTGYDYTTLNSKLEDLMLKGVVFRIGYYENVFVLKEFLKPWTMEVNGNLYIPKPWLTLHFEVRPNLLMRWASIVLNTVFMCPGMSISAIAESCEYLVPTAVQDVCELLVKCRCFKMNVMLTKDPDFFSEEETELVLEDYNRNASVNDIFVFPLPDCVTKFANFKRLTQHLCHESS